MAGQTQNRPLTQYSGDVASALFYRPVADWMPKLNRTDCPLTKLIGMGPAPAQPSIKLPWGWGHTVPNEDTLGAALSDTTGTLVTVTNPDMWAVSDQFRIDTENFLVLAVDTTNSRLTVAPRGFGGTTAATHLNGVGILRMSSATRENQNTPLSPIAQGEEDFNYFQQREASIQLSHRADVIPTYETLGLGQKGSKARNEINKKMRDELPVLLEQDLLFGARSIGDTGTPSTAGGILTTSSFITYVNTGLTGPLTELALMDQFQKVYQQVGNDNSGKKWMAHPVVLRIIASFYNGGRRLGPKDTSIGLSINQIDTGWFGTVDLIPNIWMRQSLAAGGMGPLNQIVAFNPDDLKRVPLDGSADWAIVGLPEEGWFVRTAVRTDQTLVAKNPDSRMLLGGFSVNTADYAGLA